MCIKDVKERGKKATKKKKNREKKKERAKKMVVTMARKTYYSLPEEALRVKL